MAKTLKTIGTDPELMLTLDGTPISAIEPLNFKDKYDKYTDGEVAIYHDNILVEGNVQPAHSSQEFVDNMRKLFGFVRKQFPQYGLKAQASHTFTDKDCEHPKALEFGCDPELDVDKKREVRPPSVKDAKTFRSAGGHIHIGTPETKFLDEIANKVLAITLMDLFVGVPMVLMDNDPTSLERKKLYGKAGRFRFTPYGVEYRTPSNFWASSPILAEIVADLTFWVVEEAEEGRGEELLSSCNRDEVLESINTHNKEMAAQILGKINLPDNFKHRILEASTMEHQPDVYQNW